MMPTAAAQLAGLEATTPAAAPFAGLEATTPAAAQFTDLDANAPPEFAPTECRAAREGPVPAQRR
jgi:hypothetical protein